MKNVNSLFCGVLVFVLVAQAQALYVNDTQTWGATRIENLSGGGLEIGPAGNLTITGRVDMDDGAWIRMSGGILTTTNTLKFPDSSGPQNVRMYINSGTFTAHDIEHRGYDRDGIIYVGGGTLIVQTGYNTGSREYDPLKWLQDNTIRLAEGYEQLIFTPLGGEAVRITTTSPDPNLASNPDPPDKKAIFGTEATLSWSPGAGAVHHDVYLGTDFDDVNDAVDPNVLPGRGRQDSNSFYASGLLSGQTYYWRIDEINALPPYKGKVWSFVVVDGYLNSIGMGFVRIQPGAFQMGSSSGEWDEKPVHYVTISRQFHIQITEVTADQYRLFDPTYSGTDYATGISWHDANAFCEWLSSLEAKTYRLPTEAEWEYVCRAGTTTPYSSGASPPAADTPNPWSVMNMHNSPREWVLDWHGEYPYQDQVDPVGPDQGMARVVRGGGLDTQDTYYFRSSNRAGIGPGFGGGSHNIGFRVVQGNPPTTAPTPYQVPFARQGVRKNTGLVTQGPNPAAPYFNQRPMIPIPPDNASRQAIDAAGLHPAFRGHNHSPGMEVCPNGDVLMIIYTSYSEYEPGVSLMASRLRFGSDQWDMPSYMFDFPGANDHAPMLWNDNGTLHFFWGGPRLVNANPNPYPFQWMSSTDSGATWTEVKFPKFVSSIGGHSRQPINTALRDAGNTIYVSSDAVGGTSVLWKSDDNGLTWYDPVGRTGGRHTTFVLLENGDILGMGGKNTNINGHMPKSISTDGAQSWTVSSTPFNWLGGNQRPCIVRLASQNLFFCSDYQKSFGCEQAPDISEYGSLVALSDDEGQTWTIKKLTSALPHECLCWDCGNVGTLGYSAARQAANGIIHVITTMNHPCQHFEMNEEWILNPTAPPTPPPDPGASGAVTQHQENYPGGATKATWSAKTCDDGRYLLHGTETWYYETGQKQYEVTYYNGRKVGDETYWSPEGVKQSTWDHNEPDDLSLWTQWWPNGLKHIESRWRYGAMVANGKSYFWNMCGQPEAAWNFANGELTGSTTLPPPQVKDVDLVDDGFIDYSDLKAFSDNWLISGPPGYNTADLNCDGKVKFDDFSLLALKWLESP
ncbi:MAG TPA: SUMF1/EgtB/PvdO family nonheme iron enzyme [Sedimentisphaerales bacterium]|nr:SUMF1/EgtB/PvdO family nonheme iron enzyme [Sedimentisphaerales bacterium]